MTDDQGWSGDDRRRFRRVDATFDVAYRAGGAPDMRLTLDDQEKVSSMLNISEGGISFVAQGGGVAEGAELQLKFNLVAKDGTKRTISAVGQVRYSIELADRQSSRVGVEFTRIDAQDRKAIADFVSSVPGVRTNRFLGKAGQ